MLIIGVFFISSILAVFFRRRIEWFISLMILSLSILTLFFDRFHFLKLAPFFGAFLSCISIVVFVFVLFKHRKLLEEYVFTSGGIVYIILTVFFVICNMGIRANHGVDSLSWAGSAKYIFELNDISYAIKLNKYELHPHLVEAWSYMVMKTAGGWSNNLLVTSKDVLLSSLLLPLFAFVDPNKEEGNVFKTESAKRLCVIATILLVVNIENGGTSEFAQYSVDMMLGVMIAAVCFSLYEAIQSKAEIMLVVVGMLLCAISQTKRIGICIVAIMLFWIIPLLLQYFRYIYSLCLIMSISLSYLFILGVDKYIILIIVSPILGIICYFMYQKMSHRVQIISILILCIIVGGGCVVFSFCASSYVKEIVKGYLLSIFTSENVYFGSLIKLPIGLTLLLSIVFCVVLSFRNCGNNEIEKKMICGMHLSAFLYFVMFGVLYPTQITPHNYNAGTSLPAFDRYAHTMLVALVIFDLYFMYNMVESLKVYLISLLALVLLSSNNLFLKYVFIKDETIEYPQFANSGVEFLFEDRIAYIDMSIPSKQTHYYYAFFIYFAPVSTECIEEFTQKYWEPNDIKYMDEEEFVQCLDGFSYVYLGEVSDEFIDNYKDVFEGGKSNIHENSAYRYNRDDKKLELLVGEN